MKLWPLKIHNIFTIIKLILFIFYFLTWRYFRSNLKWHFVHFLSLISVNYIVEILLYTAILKILPSKHIFLTSLIKYIHQVIYCFLLACNCLFKTLNSFVQYFELKTLLFECFIKVFILYMILMFLIFYLVLQMNQLWKCDF